MVARMVIERYGAPHDSPAAPEAGGGGTMSGDLVSLRLLLVAAAPSEQNLWRQGAAHASVPIDFSADDASACGKILAKGGVDICVIDSKLRTADKDAVLKAARAIEPAPFVVVSAPNGDGARSMAATARWPSRPMPETRASSSKSASAPRSRPAC